MVNHVVDTSFGIMGLVAAFGIAKSMAKQYGVDGSSAGAISMSAWFVLTPNLITEDGLSGITIGFGIVVGLISAWIFQWFVNRNIVIKMPDGVPPAVSKSFSALILAAAILFLTFLCALAID